ncbi:MAG: hypothetical protein HPY71_15675 [Firmicutes bacterium]|nr:hypothetical protein [Bacillota bacterium]
MALCDGALVLIADFSDRSTVAQAVASGHHVLIPLDRSDSATGDTLSLPRLQREGAGEALIAMGIPEDQAKDLAALARRSLGALRRKLAVSSVTLAPRWSKPDIARSVLPALLAGQWSDKCIGDQEAVARLARADYYRMRETFLEGEDDETRWFYWSRVSIYGHGNQKPEDAGGRCGNSSNTLVWGRL